MWTRALDLAAGEDSPRLLDAYDTVFAVGERLPDWAVDCGARLVFVRGDAWCGRCVAALVDRAHGDPMQLFDLVRDRGGRTLEQAAFAIARFPQLLRPGGRYECQVPPGRDADWVPRLVAECHPDARPLVRVRRGALTIDRRLAQDAWLDELVGYPVASAWMSQRPVGHWLARALEPGSWIVVVGCPPDAYPALAFALDAAPGVGVWADCAEPPLAERARGQLADGARLEFGGAMPDDVAVALVWDTPDAALNVAGDCAVLVHGTGGGERRRAFARMRGVPRAELRVREGLGLATHDDRLMARLREIFRFEPFYDDGGQNEL